MISRRKCNKEMVELLPLKEEADLKYVQSLLIEFKDKTGSIIAQELLSGWPGSASKFVKVRKLIFYRNIFYLNLNLLEAQNSILL